jgi:ubiquitin-like protein Pup
MARFMTTEHLRAGRSQISAPIYGAADSQQKRRPSKGGGDGEASGKSGGSKKIAKKGKELKEDMDTLMDDIDAVLEENAEEFVKNYVQRGGQ